MRQSNFIKAMAVLLLSSCVSATPKIAPQATIPAGAQYVAMGSSFAAGPGIMPQVDTPDKRCSRSENNYAHLLARSMDLALTDVSCGGAKTKHLVGAWNELPAQIDALTPQTRLVTITIGGNDVNYVGSLMRLSCVTAQNGTAPEQVAAMCGRMRAYAEQAAAQGQNLSPPPTTEADWVQLEANFRALNAEIRRRSPNARIVYVDYVTMVPEGDMCMAVPLLPQDAAEMRALATRLADVTRRAALADGAEVLQASALSADHHACAEQPWSVGLLPPANAPQSAPYHPNAAGMAGIADALATMLR
jgi:lysophospholipase L1-like esterase